MVLQRDARVELYIDTGDGDENQRMFGTLADRKDGIESTFGGALEWDPLEGRRACRISKAYESGGYRDEDKWEVVFDELADAMAKLESAVKPHLKAL